MFGYLTLSWFHLPHLQFHYSLSFLPLLCLHISTHTYNALHCYFYASLIFPLNYKSSEDSVVRFMNVRIRKSWFCIQVPSDLYSIWSYLSTGNFSHLKYETNHNVPYLKYLKGVLSKWECFVSLRQSENQLQIWFLPAILFPFSSPNFLAHPASLLPDILTWHIVSGIK